MKKQNKIIRKDKVVKEDKIAKIDISTIDNRVEMLNTLHLVYEYALDAYAAAKLNETKRRVSNKKFQELVKRLEIYWNIRE